MMISTRFAWIAMMATLLGACGGEPGQPPPGGDDPRTVLERKAGTYEGSWELYGRAADGSVSTAMTWTDVAVADRPTIESDRAYLHVVDEMTLSTGMEIIQEWIEGVLVNPDGTAGQEFIDMNGTITLLVELEPGHYQYETELAPSDFYFIEGVTAAMVVDGHHLVDKVVSSVDGKETHSIHRTTHLAWNDEAGELHEAAFESLAGIHVKTD